jgi:hypothetical protein
MVEYPEKVSGDGENQFEESIKYIISDDAKIS